MSEETKDTEVAAVDAADEPRGQSKPVIDSAEALARALGGTRQNGNQWLAPCPVPTHGKGKGDRNPSLSLRDGARRGEVLVHCFAGCSNKDVIAALRARGLWCDCPTSETVGSGAPSEALGPRREEHDARRTAFALRVWRASVGASGTLVEVYLQSRGITYPPPPTLRFHPALWHSPSRLKWPAMVALVTRGTDNTPLGIHRTFLAHDGKGKAPVEPDKMMLGPTRGGAVRLAAAGDTLMVGEGIETCLSAQQETGKPTWAALSVSGLRTLALPVGVREVVVLADGDDPSEAAAQDCAWRWKREGRRVRIARPPRGLDFNELLLSSSSRVMRALMTEGATEAVAAAIDAAEEIRDPLDDIAERAAADPAAPFKPETVDRLVELQKENPGAFEVLRRKLKGAGVRVGVLDKRIADKGRHSNRAAKQGRLRIGSDLEIARHFLREFETHSGEIVHSEGRFYAYVGSHWTAIDETTMTRGLGKYDGWTYGLFGVIRMNDQKVKSILRSAASEREQSEFFFCPPVGMNAKNGFITFGTDGTPKLLPHDREQRRRHVLPNEWGPQVELTEALLLKQLLDGCFADDDDKQGKIDLIGEMMGAAALGNVTGLKEPKAFVLHGRSAGNGKSQVLDCVRGLLPKDAVQAISPADFGDDRKVVHLVGALLNATDELGSAQAIASDRFKAIVTGDPVTGREVYAPAAIFKPQALHVFATNTLPPFRGGFDRGVQRRLIVLPFNRTIPEEERVPHLGELIVEREGAVLLAFAVDGASRLIRQGRFTELASCQTALRDWIVGADPVIAWLDECIEYDANAQTPIKTAYANFKDWAVDQGFDKFHLPAANNFSQRVYAQDGRISKGPRNNASGRSFLGLRLVARQNPVDSPDIPF